MLQYLFKLDKFFEMILNSSLRNERQTCVSTSHLLKKINACIQIITLMSFLIKIMTGNYETCPAITPNSYFFEGVIMGHHF